MALDRKDVRAKLDPDVHSALVAICDVEHIEIGEFVERELLRVIQQRVHDATVLAERTAGLGIPGIIRESSGKPVGDGK